MPHTSVDRRLCCCGQFFFFVVKEIRALKGSKLQVFVEEFLFVWDAPPFHVLRRNFVPAQLHHIFASFLSPKNLEFDKVSEDWFIQIFWNVDLMVSFLTGYYDEGALIFSIPKIALHYAKTWLLFDLSLLSMDWAFRIMVPWMEVRFFGGQRCGERQEHLRIFEP